MRKEQRVTRTTYPDGSSIEYDLNEPVPQYIEQYNNEKKIGMTALLFVILTIMFIFVSLVVIAMVAQTLNKI